MTVFYHGVCLQCGETMDLPDFCGIICLVVKLEQNTVVVVSGSEYRLFGNRIFLPSGRKLTVISGCFEGDILFWSDLCI